MNLKLHPIKNTGLMERGPSQTAWLAGAETGIAGVVLQPSGNWDIDLPTEERQRNATLESNLCVTFSGLNNIETYVDHLIANALISKEAIQKIKDLGFLDENGHFNCNEMFSARMNGSTENGNALENFWVSGRRDGLLPQKMWKDIYNDIHSFSDLYSPDVPQNLIDHAKEILKVLDINYHWVLAGTPDGAKIKEYLKQSPLHVATPVCNGWNNTEVIPCYGPSGALETACVHATTIYGFRNDDFKDFDHYSPFEKLLLKGYYIPYAIGFSITEKKWQPDVVPHYTFKKVLQLNSVGPDVVALQNILIYEGLLNSKLNTGYFGQNTFDAVVALQEKYAHQILNPLGLTFGTGKVAIMTRQFLNGKYSLQGPSLFSQISQFFSSFFFR